MSQYPEIASTFQPQTGFHQLQGFRSKLVKTLLLGFSIERTILVILKLKVTTIWKNKRGHLRIDQHWQWWGPKPAPGDLEQLQPHLAVRADPDKPTVFSGSTTHWTKSWPPTWYTWPARTQYPLPSFLGVLQWYNSLWFPDTAQLLYKPVPFSTLLPWPKTSNEEYSHLSHGFWA